MITVLDEQLKTSGPNWSQSVLIFCVNGVLFKSAVIIGDSGADAQLEHISKDGEWISDVYQDGYTQTELKPKHHGGDLPLQTKIKHEKFKQIALKLCEYLPKTKGAKNE